MIKDILLNFNWIDALIGAFIIRCVFIGLARGLIIEFFKFLGIVFATIITLHLYVRFGRFLHQTIRVPNNITELLAFFLLLVAAILIFKMIREGWMVLHKNEETTRVSRIFGGLLGMFRGLLVAGLVFVMLFLSGNEFLKKSGRQSFSGFYMEELSPRLYEVTFEGIIVKLFPEEKKNEKLFILFEKKSTPR
jgi:uncharacterized membrane protein required for colicin V production